jgi:RNA polymerase sigma factor (sigma-70 family)
MPGAWGTFRPGNSFFRVRPKGEASCEAEEDLDSDAQLVELCLREDAAAWEELVRRHLRRLYRICYRFTGKAHEAEDLTQEVFLRVYQTLKSYRAEQGKFGTWLTSVARNLLIDHYRRTRHDRQTSSFDDEESGVGEQPARGRLPDELAGASELRAEVQRALARLSPELREAVILRDLEGLEYREIQQVLGVPEGTVKSRINRGRIELGRVLEQMGWGPKARP